MNIKIILPAVILVSTSCAMNTRNEITIYNKERDKTIVENLLQNNRFNLPTTSFDALANYFNQVNNTIDKDVQTPHGTSVHVVGTETYAAKVIIKTGDNKEQKAAGFICYSISVMKEPMPTVIGLIPCCIAENSDFEKELFTHVLNEFSKSKEIIIYVHTHMDNVAQNELLRQLGFTCIGEGIKNPQTGASSNINVYMLIKSEAATQTQPTSEGKSEINSIVKYVTKDTVESEIKQSALPVILDFYGTWCPPCKQLAPIIEELARENEGKYLFIKYNADTPCDFVAALCKEHKIRGIPTLFFFNNGQVKGVHTGYLSKEALKEKIKEYLA